MADDRNTSLERENFSLKAELDAAKEELGRSERNAGALRDEAGEQLARMRAETAALGAECQMLKEEAAKRGGEAVRGGGEIAEAGALLEEERRRVAELSSALGEAQSAASDALRELEAEREKVAGLEIERDAARQRSAEQEEDLAALASKVCLPAVCLAACIHSFFPSSPCNPLMLSRQHRRVAPFMCACMYGMHFSTHALMQLRPIIVCRCAVSHPLILPRSSVRVLRARRRACCRSSGAGSYLTCSLVGRRLRTLSQVASGLQSGTEGIDVEAAVEAQEGRINEEVEARVREAVVRRTKAGVDAGVAKEAPKIREMVEAEVARRVQAKVEASEARIASMADAVVAKRVASGAAGASVAEEEARESPGCLRQLVSDAEAASLIAARELALSQERIKVGFKPAVPLSDREIFPTHPSSLLCCRSLCTSGRRSPPSLSLPFFRSPSEFSWLVAPLEPSTPKPILSMKTLTLSQSLEAQLVTSLQQRSSSTSPRLIPPSSKDSGAGKSLHSFQFLAVPAAIAAVAAVVIAAQKK